MTTTTMVLHDTLAFDRPEGSILTAYRGSIAHGMYVPKEDPTHIDDVDIMGVVVASPECYFGLQEWGSRGTKEFVQGHYDCVWYEVRKAFGLLLQGNPNIVGLLWLKPEHYIDMTAEGRKIVDNRHLFSGKHVYNAFAGYAHAQLEKMTLRDPADLRLYLALTEEAKHRGIHPNHKGERFPAPEPSGESKNVAQWKSETILQGLASYARKGDNIGYMGDKRKRLVLEHGYDAKNAAHCVRLLRMAKEYLDTGVMNVYRERDGEELLEIKRGGWSLDKVKEEAKRLFEEVKQARDRSALSEGPDRAGAERLLVEIVRERLG